jgi:hypothetical protein
MLEVDDDGFWEGLYPLPLGDLPVCTSLPPLASATIIDSIPGITGHGAGDWLSDGGRHDLRHERRREPH